MTLPKIIKCTCTLVLAGFFTLQVNAALISVSLGNATTGFNDGDVLSLVPDIIDAQAGQPAPFDIGYGNELSGNPAALNWLFAYAPITDTILSASLVFGVFDIDTSSSGSQLDAFSIDGVDTSATLDAQFEAKASGDNVFNQFEIPLDSGFFASLMDGSFGASLDIGGTGLQTALPFLGGGVSETGQNGFHLIFSTLNITTQDVDTGPGTPVPEPSSIALLSIALLGLFRKRLTVA